MPSKNKNRVEIFPHSTFVLSVSMVALLNANFQLRDIYRCLIYLYLKNTPEIRDEMHFICVNL